ncbi:MAG TPA: OmpA family protein [Thermoanaerobaculia bacterium]|nr:OmpA family protein [Thermoanaerobaculia bacterium]
MADHHDHERETASERVRHWLIVTSLTFLGLLVAELPVLSQTRDRVYLWLQERLVRSHKTVVVVAIDDDDFWRELRGARPLDRDYLTRLLAKVADANPAAIGLDVGLEMNRPDVRPQWNLLTGDEQAFLRAVDAAAKRCPVILPRTITGSEHLASRYDLFDAIAFSGDAAVAYGHTSSARDPRQIPTRVRVDKIDLLDSFAMAVFRTVTREVPAKLDDPDHAWPYSFFLPTSTFVPKDAPVGRDGLLTARAVLSASPAQAKRWLERQVVLIGGTWRVAPHDGSDFADAHRTPMGTLPGVVVHANYVQSLLWDAMYAMPRTWRLALEIVLALAISVGFLIARGWWRLALVVATLVTVVLLTWVFSSAIGLFFDMVIPVAFLGVHALWEQSSEELRLDFRRKFRYADHVFSGVAVAAVLISGFLFVRHEIHANERELRTEDRLQVTELTPPPPPSLPPADGLPQEMYAQKSPEVEKTGPPLDPPKPKPEERTAQKVPLDKSPPLRERRISPEQLPPMFSEDEKTHIVETATLEHAHIVEERAARIAAERSYDEVVTRYEASLADASKTNSEVEQLRRQVEDQAVALRSLQERERLSEAAIASQLEAEERRLASARSEGSLAPEVLTQREQQIAQQREELRRLQREREETARLRAEVESARATAIAEVERRRSEAEAQAAQLRQQIAEERARAAQSEAELARAREELARRDEINRARIDAMQAELAKLAQTRSDERGFIVTLPGLFFDSAKSVLKPGARNTLTKIAEQLRRDPDAHIEIEGHTDSVGSDSMNQALSEKRAAAVRDFLAARGVPAVRITFSGRGESTPVASNDTPAGRQQNRRVELVIVPAHRVSSNQ